jgi:general stress protein YciG
MGQTTQGAIQAKATIKEKYGDDYYAKIGAMGGRSYNRLTSPPKGFAADIERAREAGRKGGLISRRWKKSEA